MIMLTLLGFFFKLPVHFIHKCDFEITIFWLLYEYKYDVFQFYFCLFLSRPCCGWWDDQRHPISPDSIHLPLFHHFCLGRLCFIFEVGIFYVQPPLILDYLCFNVTFLYKTCLMFTFLVIAEFIYLNYYDNNLSEIGIERENWTIRNRLSGIMRTRVIHSCVTRPRGWLNSPLGVDQDPQHW